MKNENKIIFIELYKKFDNLISNEIENMVKTLNNYKNESFPEETIILFKCSLQSLLLSLELYDRDDLVNSTCILRSVFENTLCSLAISIDKETLQQYRHKDWNVYKQVLNRKRKEEKEKNPKSNVKKPNKNDFKMEQKNIRETIAKNYSIVLPNFFDEKHDNPQKVLNDTYNYLCSIVHPSIVKTCTYKMQENMKELKIIKILFKINIYCLTMMLMSAYSYITSETIDIQLDMISLTILLSFVMVDDIKNIQKVYEKYSDYLYIDINYSYIKDQREKVKQLEKELKEVTRDKEVNELIKLKFASILEFYNIK